LIVILTLTLIKAVESWEKTGQNKKVWFHRAKNGVHTKSGETILEKHNRLHQKLKDIEEEEEKTYKAPTICVF